jgi:hypothetical protein
MKRELTFVLIWVVLATIGIALAGASVYGQ